MQSESVLRETEQFFHEQIPLTRAMGVRVESYDGEQLILTAPLDRNHNHLGTAFGGSLSVMATLAGYGLIWLELGDRQCHLVIRDSSMNYHRPVKNDIRAICRRPEGQLLTAFKEQFLKKGKARIRLEVTIEEAGEKAVDFSGTYVAMR